MISSRDFRGLGELFPTATEAIEDLHLSACYSASDIRAWPTIFRNLLTIWAYSGSAPGTYSGAELHLRFWDRSTRGKALLIDRTKSQGTRKGHNVAVWSRTYGLQTTAVEPLAAIKARLTDGEATLKSFFDGDTIVVDAERGPLRDYYNDVQAALQHPDFAAGDRPALERRREATIRLIHFDHAIRVRFSQHYASQIAAGYAAIGINPPNFATLSRKATLLAITAFAAKADQSPPAAARLRSLLFQGLRDLSGELIPITWV